MNWPFKTMQVGEIQVLWDVNPAQAAMAAHNTGRYKGWAFKTKKVVDPETGRVGIAVKRLQDPVGAAPVASAGRTFTLYGYEDLAVNESITLKGEPEWLGRALAGIQARERKFGIKLKRKTELHPVTRAYVALTVTRIE